jgi:hypothetical protein
MFLNERYPFEKITYSCGEGTTLQKVTQKYRKSNLQLPKVLSATKGNLQSPEVLSVTMSKPVAILELRHLLQNKVKERQCANCGITTYDKLKQCTGCRTIYYCNERCQKTHWPTHKTNCKLMKGMGDLINKIDDLDVSGFRFEDMDTLFGVVICVSKTKEFMELLDKSDDISNSDILETYPYIEKDAFMSDYKIIRKIGDLPDDSDIARLVFEDLRADGRLPLLIYCADLRHHLIREVHLKK